ncbi:hypothetical protein [Brevibacillus sp. SIMBA_040]
MAHIVRNLEDVEKLVEAGATRISTSSGNAIEMVSNRSLLTK